MHWELIVTFFLGALHSIEPGHGKTAMFSLMFNQKSKWWDCLALALSLVISHASILFFIAGLTHFGGQFILGEEPAERVQNIIAPFASSFMIVLGIFLIFKKKKVHKCCHESKQTDKGSLKVPILVGLTIGLYPCPSLMASFFASLSTGQLNLGLLAVCLFSLGSFLSILISAFSLKWLGKKFSQNIGERLPKVNLNQIQGAVIFTTGLVSLFFQ